MIAIFIVLHTCIHACVWLIYFLLRECVIVHVYNAAHFLSDSNVLQ